MTECLSLRRIGRSARVLSPAALLAALLVVAGNRMASAIHGAEAEPVVVESVKPKKQNLVCEIANVGSLSPYEKVAVRPLVAGFVERWNVDMGDKVRKGDLLATISAPEVESEVKVRRARVQRREIEVNLAKASVVAAEAAVTAADARLLAAKAIVERAQAEFDRWDKEVRMDERLKKKGVLDKAYLDEAPNQRAAAEVTRDEAKAALKAAEAAVAMAKAELQKAKVQVELAMASIAEAKAEYEGALRSLDSTRLAAPFDGIVTHRTAATGEAVIPAGHGGASAPLFVIERGDMIRVMVQVPERKAALIKEGARAVVGVDALLDKELAGKVTRTSWSLDADHRCLTVEILLPNTDGEIRPGMSATVTIFAEVNDVLALPRAAVRGSGDQASCTLVEGGKAQNVSIKLGAIGKDAVQVLAYKKSGGDWQKFTGDEVLIIPGKGPRLKDGDPVKVR